MKGRLVILVALAAALSAVGASYWAFFVRPERAPEVLEAPPEALTITSITGTVEVAGPDGLFHPASLGERLLPRDRIRTGDDGLAELRAADGSTVKLSGATEARVDELRRELKRLHLGTGMVEADVRDDPTRVFEVTLDDDGATARTRGAAFTATSNGAGTAAVGARRGEVTLSARGKEVVIRTGQFARITPGSVPEAPQPIPPSLFLKVEWPPERSSSTTLHVEGQTMPGARVRVAGRWVQVGADGHYVSNIRTNEGPHQLSVSAVDVAGHVVDEKSPRIVVDTHTDFKVQSPKWK